MPLKFQNKYRIKSIRLKNWDYRNNGAYFITICTQNRRHFFGEIIDKKMELNEIGLLANNFWAEIPNHFSFVELGNFQIMPNHMHGILIVDALHCNVSNNDQNDSNQNDSNQNDSNQNDANQNDSNQNDSNQNFLNQNISNQNDLNQSDTLQCNASTENKNEFLSKISPKSGSISTIIRSYKSVVSKNSRLINPEFQWQSGFHDHIVRNSESFDNIQNYIENNPINWKEDTFYT